MPDTPHAGALIAERSALLPPDHLVDVVVEVAGDVWGATDAAVLLATHEQTELVPLAPAGPRRAGPRRTTQAVDDGAAGRCFTTGARVVDGATTWVPLTHRGERVGVVGVDGVSEPRGLDAYAAAIALQVVASRGYSDAVEVARRTQEMSVGAELLTSIVPPLAYADQRFSLAAVLEPAYSSGGDAIDHAVDGDLLRVLVVDATGHGFNASLISAVAVAAYRTARRAGDDLLGTWALLDRFVGDAGDDDTFATGVLVEIDLGTGRVAWVSAGHPTPVIVRGDGETAVLEAEAAPPLGTGLGGHPEPGEDYLEPGDVLVLHSDGITEARGLDGQMLGLDGFLDALRGELAGGGPLDERLRRLRLGLLTRDDTWIGDDATAVLVEWHGQEGDVVNPDDASHPRPT